MILTNAFKEKWIRLFGYEPKKNEIEKMVKEGRIIQNFRVLRQKNGMFYKIPQLIWYGDIILKYDKEKDVMITFVARG